MNYTVIKHSGHLRTLEKGRKHSRAARVLYISLVFSNSRRFLSQCRLRLLYLLNIIFFNCSSSNRNGRNLKGKSNVRVDRYYSNVTVSLTVVVTLLTVCLIACISDGLVGWSLGL